MMFWYIGGILAGFAIGYVIAIAQKRDRTTYKKGVNDCRNCKNMVWIADNGTIQCKKAKDKFLLWAPKACSFYSRVEDTWNEE